MTRSSLLGGDSTPRQPSGTDVASLGPSDLSDSGSDISMGALNPEMLDSDSDSLGTGERASVDGRSPPSGADILPDHLEGGATEPGDEDLQQALDFDDEEVAEQAEDAAGAAMDHPELADTPEDVGGLALDDSDEDSEEGEGRAAPNLDDARRGGGPGHDIP